MDLTNFTGKKERVSRIDDDVIVDNEDAMIVVKGDDIEFFLKSEAALEKYRDYLFLSTTDAIESSDEKEIESFFRKALDAGTEGMMVKSCNASYLPGMRTGAMAKVKETKEDVDVVILAAEHGTGKRAGYYSSFYIGVYNKEYNDEDDMFLTIGKVSSGILELGEEGHSMSNLTNMLKPLKVREEGGVVYFEPKIVLQVRYQEIQKSNAYNSGYALRFPRIISLRDDKDVNEINSIDDVESFV